MSKLSFVLPTKDRVEWAGQCIQSLMDQTEKDIEIVIVNDGSTDGTKEFLDSWATQDKRVKVIHNETSQGGGNSRNIGMIAATSEIIAVCDDDDFYPNDRAEKTLEWFKDHPACELVNYPYVRVDYFDAVLETFPGAEFDYKLFKENGVANHFCNPTVAYKKKSAEEIGGYKAETKDQTDDYQFLTNWIKAGKKVDFDKRIFAVCHRVLPKSMMSKHRGFRPEWAVKNA